MDRCSSPKPFPPPQQFHQNLALVKIKPVKAQALYILDNCYANRQETVGFYLPLRLLCQYAIK